MLDGASLPGGRPVAVEIRDGVIVRLHDHAPPGVPRVDLRGRTLVPGVIDGHVHLAYAFGPRHVARGRALLGARGVVAGVDMAAPVEALAAFDPTRWPTSGPMLTATGGYPTQGWGADGYGREIAGPAHARRAVDALVDAGASLIKVPIEAATHGSALDDRELAAIVAHAHARGLRVAAHALADADAARAAALGVDVLAHTPLEPLADATVAALSDRAVVSTLGAFGASDVAVDNLRRLHDAGTLVLYGTDLGNSPVLGIDADELALLRHAGLSPAEVLAAATSRPAAFWGMDELGALAPGRAASLLVLDRDPLDDPTALARPVEVWLDGVRVGPEAAPR